MHLLLAHTGLFCVQLAGPLVAVFYCMSATAEQATTFMAWAGLIFAVCVGIQLLIVLGLYKPVGEVVSRSIDAKDFSDEKLIIAAKQNSALPIHLSILYGLSMFIACGANFLVYHSYEIGAISAFGIWGGALAGTMACPFMVLGATSLILGANTEYLADQLRRRNLACDTARLKVFPKLLCCFIGFAVGLAIWLGSAAFYTGINQTIEEIKYGDGQFLKAIILRSENGAAGLQPEALFKTVSSSYPDRQFFLTDPAGHLSAGSRSEDLTIPRWQGLAQELSEGLASAKAGTLYDNVNERVISWIPIDKNSRIGVISSLSPRLSRYTSFFIWSAIFIVVGFVVGMALGITNVLATARSIQRAALALGDLAGGEGDLKTRLAVISEDEVGDLARRFNTFVDKLYQIVQSIVEKAKAIQSSSQNFSGLSHSMSADIEVLQQDTAHMLQVVAGASEELKGVSASCDDTNTNVNHVSVAAEEMAASVGEVAKRSEDARQITKNAVAVSKNASERILKLGSAAKDIDKVTEAITEISEQINLLALNATIESARAGEAGKGFAVVANEIKELARQTAQATNEIKERITGMQRSTDDTVQDMSSISQVIGSISEFVFSIAGAVEEQSETTREIASNIAHVSVGIADVNKSVAKNAESSQHLSSQMQSFHQKADNILTNSAQVDEGARSLLKISEQLGQQLSKFKL